MTDLDMPHHEFYKQYISPYKGELEMWYYWNQNLILDVKLIALTVLVIIRPGLDLHKYLQGLPEKSLFLRQLQAGTLNTEIEHM